MTLGRAPEQADIWKSSVTYCEGKLSPTSVYRLLHAECDRLFPDDMSALGQRPAALGERPAPTNNRRRRLGRGRRQRTIVADD
jgi:hypothetical protein